MKGVIFGVIGSIMLFLTSCTKDNLVFPEKVDSDEEKELIDIIVKPTDVAVIGDYDQHFVFKWPVFNEKINKVKISYIDGGDTKEVMVTDFSKDFQMVTSTIGEYKFRLSSITTDGRETAVVEKVATNKGIYIDEIIQFVGASVSGDNIVIDWSNPLLTSIDVSVFYQTAAGETVYNATHAEERGEFSFSGTVGTKARLQFKDAKGNTASHTVEYGWKNVEVTSAVQKAGWIAEVSANQSNDGGGAPALIDGNLTTYWHTPYDGSTNFPYHATLTLNAVRSVSHIILVNRSTGGAGAPKDFDVQSSNDGINFTTIKSFVNTNYAGGGVATFELDAPLKTRYIRLYFRTSNTSGRNYMNLGEISIKERLLEITN